MARNENSFNNETWLQVGLALAVLGRSLNGAQYAGYTLEGGSFRGPRMPGDEYLVVLRGIDEDEQPVVAFHSGFTLEDTIRGVANRLENGTLKWRSDEFRK